MRRASLEQAERSARELAKYLGSKMPEGFGFILWITSFGADGVGTYVSSIERDCAIRSIQEWIARVKADDRTKGPGFVDDTGRSCWCCGDKAGALVTLRGPLRSVEVCANCILTERGPT